VEKRADGSANKEPVFDITPGELIAGFITPVGIYFKPYSDELSLDKRIMQIIDQKKNTRFKDLRETAQKIIQE
jgi:hypothetical protein